MNEEQNPMTGFKTLELAFSQGFRMEKVSGTNDIFYVKDRGLRAFRYTYARLDNLKVLQIIVLDENEPLNGIPCFCLFYGTLEKLREKGKTTSFIKEILTRFKNNLPSDIREYYIETIVELDNKASLAIASKLFGEPAHDGTDEITGEETRIWQTKIVK